MARPTLKQFLQEAEQQNTEFEFEFVFNGMPSGVVKNKQDMLDYVCKRFGVSRGDVVELENDETVKVSQMLGDATDFVEIDWNVRDARFCKDKESCKISFEVV